MTSFLANTFILQGASSEYAKVEYTTAIELFLQVNITFIMIAMLEYMTVIQTNPDITFLWCQPSKCNEVVVKMKAMGIKNENFMECYANNFENPDHKIVSKSIQKMENVEKSVSVPNLHNIDRVGRILIPIMYTLFNIAYFAYFLLWDAALGEKGQYLTIEWNSIANDQKILVFPSPFGFWISRI